MRKWLIVSRTLRGSGSSTSRQRKRVRLPAELGASGNLSGYRPTVWRRLQAISRRSEIWNDAIFTVSLADGKFTPFSQPSQPFGGLTVSPDRKYISFFAPHRAGPEPHDVFFQPVSGGPARDVTAGLDRVAFGLKWQSGSAALISIDDGFRPKLYRLPVNGTPKRVDVPSAIGDFAVAKDGTIAFVGHAFNRLPDLFVQKTNGSPEQVSHVQEGWEGITLANAELFHFKSFDGREVEAALMKPVPPPNPAAKLPLVLYVHGGPAGSFSETYYSWAQLLAAHGYEVLMINPRGSTGYGEEFLKANRSDWGGGDFKDLMAGLDAVIARGETDPNRLGIGGWSYGGYMAEWAITQTDRFKAAVSGAGMFDLAAEFGTEVGRPETNGISARRGNIPSASRIARLTCTSGMPKHPR